MAQSKKRMVRFVKEVTVVGLDVYLYQVKDLILLYLSTNEKKRFDPTFY